MSITTGAGQALHRASEDGSEDRRDGVLRLFGVGATPLSNDTSPMAWPTRPARSRGSTCSRRLFSSMVHDFFVTDRHVLFPILPLTGSLQRAMRGKPAFAWEPEKGSHVGVMRRDARASRRCAGSHRSLLRLPPDERLGRGRQDLCRRDAICPPRRCSPMPMARRESRSARYLVRWTSISPARPTRSSSDEARRHGRRIPALRRAPRGAFLSPRLFRRERPMRRHRQSHLRLHRPYRLPDGQAHGARHFADGDVPGEPIFMPRTPSAAEGEGYL
jgi:hypothetical protein